MALSAALKVAFRKICGRTKPLVRDSALGPLSQARGSRITALQEGKVAGRQSTFQALEEEGRQEVGASPDDGCEVDATRHFSTVSQRLVPAQAMFARWWRVVCHEDAPFALPFHWLVNFSQKGAA